MKRLLCSLFVGLVVVLSPGAALAANSTDILTGNNNGVDCSQGSNAQSAVCTDDSKGKYNPLTGCSTDSNNTTNCGHGILADATNIISFAAGAAAVIIIIIGALQFATSGSDLSTNSRTDTDVENAKRTITSALIGLVVIVLARSLILFVLSRL